MAGSSIATRPITPSIRRKSCTWSIGELGYVVLSPGLSQVASDHRWGDNCPRSARGSSFFHDDTKRAGLYDYLWTSVLLSHRIDKCIDIFTRVVTENRADERSLSPRANVCRVVDEYTVLKGAPLQGLHI